MRITTRIAVALTLLGLLLFGVYGKWMLEAEQRDLNLAAEREMRLLGRALQVAAGTTLRDQHLGEARLMLDRLATIDPHLQVVVLTREGRLLLSSDQVKVDALVRDVAREVAAKVASGVEPPNDRVVRHDSEEDPRRLVIGLPLVASDRDTDAYLVLIRALDEMRLDLDKTRSGVQVSFFAFVAIVWTISASLGVLYLGRPLRRLSGAMRQIRAGDLASDVAVEGPDEIGEVAHEFNAMVLDLRAARRALEEAAEARGRDQRTLQQADKLITIGQLSAGLAHEIGSPLQIVAGRARALHQRAEDAAEVRRMSSIIVDQADRIARIVEQLLQYTRRRPARTSSVDPAAVVRSVTDLLQLEAKRRGVALRVHCSPEAGNLEGDADQLQQLVLNLVNNGIQASARGDKVAVTVRSDAAGSDNVLILTVSDTGRGIPTELLDRLFDPFFTTRSAEGGTGLGLTVVRAIVTEHRGHIAVESEPGRGTTFTVTLPSSARRSVAGMPTHAGDRSSEHG